MNEECLSVASGKGKYQHEGVVQSEASHVVVSVQGASAVVKVLVCLQQATVGIVDIFNNILIASVLQLVHDGVSVAGIEIIYSRFSFLTGGRSSSIIKKKKRSLPSSAVLNGAKEGNSSMLLCLDSLKVILTFSSAILKKYDL